MGDWLLAIATILGAGIYLYADAKLPRLDIGDPMGPQVFPALIGVGLLLSGVLLVLETWRKRAAAAPQTMSAPEDPSRRRHQTILVAMAAWTAVYYVAFEPVGYVVATVIYLYALLAFFNRGRWLVNAAITLGFTACAYAVFAKFLLVVLPDGVLGL
jgi:putative tricarboxylic transport membrane protein